MKSKTELLGPFRVLFLALFLGPVACASDNIGQDDEGLDDKAPEILVQAEESAEPEDPYETTNRDVLEGNLWVYDNVLSPVGDAYVWATPEFARDGISNAFDNLGTPAIFVNDVLQGEAERAGISFGRFAINSTVGIAGLIDVASYLGLEKHEEDFGQTLAVYGVGDGPYIVLPFIGPTNPRDTVGWLVDLALDPTNYLLTPIVSAALYTGSVVDDQAARADEIDTMLTTSLDPYSTIRIAYYQNRQFEISNGEPGDGEDGFGFYEYGEDERIDPEFEELTENNTGDVYVIDNTSSF